MWKKGLTQHHVVLEDFSHVMAHCFMIEYNPLQWPKLDILGTSLFPLINSLLPLCRFQIMYQVLYLQMCAQRRPS